MILYLIKIWEFASFSHCDYNSTRRKHTKDSWWIIPIVIWHMVQRCNVCIWHIVVWSVNHYSEYLRVSEITIYECLHHFCRNVMKFSEHITWESQWLIATAIDANVRGETWLPRMLGCIICMHWRWTWKIICMKMSLYSQCSWSMEPLQARW